MREPEDTRRIRREHLLELLETEAPVRQQRTTARMPAMTLTDLLALPEEAPPIVVSPRPIVVSFRTPTPQVWDVETWPRGFVVAVSFSATLLVISLLLRLL